LTKDPNKQKEFVESLLFRYGPMRKKSLEFLSYDADELIAHIILERSLSEGKVDAEFYPTAFEHLKEKRLLRSFLKVRKDNCLRVSMNLRNWMDGGN
jgi:hypothetical protein